MQPALVQTRESDRKLALRAVGRASLLSLLFIGAGRVDWLGGWLFSALMVLTAIVNALVMRWKNPGLVRARLETHDDVKPFDKIFFRVAVPLGGVFLLVAGLDQRFAWSSVAPDWIYLGIALHVAGSIPILAAMIHNPFLEFAVRIQNDRGQVTVSSGPYALVRHPMYAGLIVMFTGWPLVLGSLWAYTPLAAVAVAYVVRTFYEDRTLQQELPGYTAFCERTRYRLVPGLW